MSFFILHLLGRHHPESSFRVKILSSMIALRLKIYYFYVQNSCQNIAVLKQEYLYEYN